jgi:hypothetical protein
VYYKTWGWYDYQLKVAESGLFNEFGYTPINAAGRANFHRTAEYFTYLHDKNEAHK